MSNDQNYREQIASYQRQVNAARQSKLEEDWRTEYYQAINSREESLANRQEIERQAALTADPNEQAALKHEWHMHDEEIQRCEADIQRLTPPPQADPNMLDFTRRISPWTEKHGAAGLQKLDMLHRYATTPRHPHADPQKVAAGQHGAGLRPGTRQ